jgi:TRAP transporter TAXI family solute receptor
MSASTPLRLVRGVAAFLATAALLLTACQPLGQGDDAGSPGPGATGATGDGAGGGQLTIATGGTGGVYYVLGGGLATVISDNVEGYSATAQETNASVDNMQLIASGGADIAFSLSDTAADAVEGREDFEGAPVEACALGLLYDNYTQLVSSSGAGIASVEDLRGKVVSLGSPGSGTEVIALRILEVAGIDPDADIERQQLGIDDTVAALRDGTIDAGFWSGGLPTGALTDLASTDPIQIVPTAEYVGALQDAHGPTYMESTIPADTYPGLTGDVATIGVPNYLVVNESMDEELAYQLTKLLFERKDALVQVHPEAANLELQNAQMVEPLQLHPGAQRYYDEAA